MTTPPDGWHDVLSDIRDPEADLIAARETIAALRAALDDARNFRGAVTAETHARAVREAWGPSDPLEWDEQVARWWLPDPTRLALIATLTATGIPRDRAVALADGGSNV